MYVNSSLSNAAQLLAASTFVKTIVPDDTGAPADAILQTVHQVSNQTGSSAKQASATIGGAMLSLDESSSPSSVEAAR